MSPTEGEDYSEAIEGVASLMGYNLAPWQRMVLGAWSRHTPEGSWVHRRCGASVPRQAGKSVIAIVWVTFLVVILGYSVLWTDHNYSTTCEMLRRFRKIFGSKANDPNAPKAFNRLVESTSSKTSQEKYEFVNGGVLCFSTRTESASLGFSFDVIIYDEAQLLTAEQAQTLQPTTSSGPHRNTQSILVGTPTRAGCAADNFRAMREEAIDTPEPDLCWFEWGVDEVGDVFDEARYYAVNPSLHGGVADIEAIKSSIRLMSSDKLGIAQEYLGYWVPGASSAVVSRAQWEACAIADADTPKNGGVVAYGVKFSPDGALVALSACRKTEAGYHVELVQSESTADGVSWLAKWLIERKTKAAAVAVDGLSGAGALRQALAGKVPRGYVMAPRTSDICNASAMTLEAIKNKTLTHIEGTELDVSATESIRRKVGGGGGWSWGGEASLPMESAALALWAAETTKRNPNRKGAAA